MNEIRASRLPLALTCPASQFPPQVHIERLDGAARLGTATHDVLAVWIDRDRPEADDIAAAARARDVDAADLAPLAWTGWKCWQSIREHFPEPILERYLDSRLPMGTRLTGHADLMSLSALPGEVRIADWKSGYAEGDYLPQLRGYGWLALQEWPEAERVYATLVQIRTQTAQSYRWERAELEAWASNAEWRLGTKHVHAPGVHCAYCPRWHECIARESAVLASVRMLGAAVELPADPAERGRVLGELRDRVKLVERAVAEAKALIHVEVQQAGGKMPLGDGRALVLRQVEQKRIDAAAGWNALASHLPKEDILECISIAKGKIESAVAGYAPRGKKTQAVKDMLDHLDKAGALKSSFVERLEIEREIANEPSDATAIGYSASGTERISGGPISGTA